MTEVEDFIYQFDKNQREVMLHLHNLLTLDLSFTAKIRFKIPFYYGRSWICYLNPIKNEGIELAFLRGCELSNTQGLLESKGRKQVSGIELNSILDAPLEAILEVIHEAIMLDETIPYASKRKLL